MTENQKQKKDSLQIICVSALMLALSTALSFVKIWNMPWGGSITLLSMLPVCLISIKYGLKRGLFASFVYSVIQLIFGITVDGIFSWGLTAQMLVACIMLDYILAFTLLGFAGIFRKRGIWGVILGTVFAVFLRFISHFLSGAFVFASAGKLWEGFSTDNVYLYSLVYNACYMLPEIILTCIGALFIYKAIDKILK